LLVTDQGIHSRKLDLKCIQSLEKSGYEVLVYSNVTADPPEQNIFDAVELSKSQNICGVVGFGGGSSMDVAKLVAFLSNKECQQSLSEIYGVGNCIGNRLPLIQVPTTAGTGSEVTPISIITTGASEKKGIVSTQLLPDWAVLDGELTLSLPAPITDNNRPVAATTTAATSSKAFEIFVKVSSHSNNLTTQDKPFL
jgi:alcohol dehydrogenase